MSLEELHNSYRAVMGAYSYAWKISDWEMFRICEERAASLMKSIQEARDKGGNWR